MAQIWNVEGRNRPGFWIRLARGLMFIGLLGLDLALTATVTELGAFAANRSPWFRVANLAVSTALNAAVFVAAFRLLTPKQIALRDLIPGAILGGIAWTVLQLGGTYLIAHQLRHSSQVYGFFAIVLGLLSWLYLSAQVSLYAAELNVVRARRLWPRSILQPPFTGPDRAVLRGMVEQEIRRPEQRVEVGFVDTDPKDGDEQ